MSTDEPRTRLFSPLSPVVALLTLLAAAGRAYLGRSVLVDGPMEASGLNWVYLAEAVGFLILLVMLYAPLPGLPRDRSGIRFLLITYCLANIAAYLVVESAGRYDAIGLAQVALMILLMAAAAAESRRLSPATDEPFAVRHPAEH